jgi:hypothetical protein
MEDDLQVIICSFLIWINFILKQFFFAKDILTVHNDLVFHFIDFPRSISFFQVLQDLEREILLKNTIQTDWVRNSVPSIDLITHL